MRCSHIQEDFRAPTCAYLSFTTVLDQATKSQASKCAYRLAIACSYNQTTATAPTPITPANQLGNNAPTAPEASLPVCKDGADPVVVDDPLCEATTLEPDAPVVTSATAAVVIVVVAVDSPAPPPPLLLACAAAAVVPAPLLAGGAAASAEEVEGEVEVALGDSPPDWEEASVASLESEDEGDAAAAASVVWGFEAANAVAVAVAEVVAVVAGREVTKLEVACTTTQSRS